MSSQILVICVSCTLLTENHPSLTAGPVRIEEWLDRSTTRASHGTSVDESEGGGPDSSRKRRVLMEMGILMW